MARWSQFVGERVYVFIKYLCWLKNAFVELNKVKGNWNSSWSHSDTDTTKAIDGEGSRHGAHAFWVLTHSRSRSSFWWRMEEFAARKHAFQSTRSLPFRLYQIQLFNLPSQGLTDWLRSQISVWLSQLSPSIQICVGPLH